MAPRVRLRPALLPDARTLAEVAFLAPLAFPPSATEPRPQANRPKYYDSSSRLLFSPAFLSSRLKKSKRALLRLRQPHCFGQSVLANQQIHLNPVAHALFIHRQT